MPHQVTLTVQIGRIRHEATLDLPDSFHAPDIFDEKQDAIALLHILQYQSRITLQTLDKQLTQTPTHKQEAAE